MAMKKAVRPRIQPGPEGWNSATLHAALAARYPAPEFAFLTEVRNHTAFNGTTRSADAMAMGLWPSRGLHLHGFELKCSRGDWLRERNDPAKAEALARYCDFWWLVVADAALVQDGELPAGWGLLAPRGGRLVAIREAPPRTPDPIDRKFLASLLRRVTEDAPKETLEPLVRARVSEAQAQWERREREEILRLRERVQDAERTRETFERASGIRLDAWNARPMGDLVRLAHGGHGARILGPLQEALRNAQSLLEHDLPGALAALAAQCPDPPETRACLTDPADPARVLVARDTRRLPCVTATRDHDADALLAHAVGSAPLRTAPLGFELAVEGGRERRVALVTAPCQPRADAYVWVDVAAELASPSGDDLDFRALALYDARHRHGRLPASEPRA